MTCRKITVRVDGKVEIPLSFSRNDSRIDCQVADKGRWKLLVLDFLGLPGKYRNKEISRAVVDRPCGLVAIHLTTAEPTFHSPSLELWKCAMAPSTLFSQKEESKSRAETSWLGPLIKGTSRTGLVVRNCSCMMGSRGSHEKSDKGTYRDLRGRWT